MQVKLRNLKVLPKVFHFTDRNVRHPFTSLFFSVVSPSFPQPPPPSFASSPHICLTTIAPAYSIFFLYSHILSGPFPPLHFHPLLPSRPHIYHFFSSARLIARPSAHPGTPPPHYPAPPPPRGTRHCNLPRLILSIALNDDERAPVPPSHQ